MGSKRHVALGQLRVVAGQGVGDGHDYIAFMVESLEFNEALNAPVQFSAWARIAAPVRYVWEVLTDTTRWCHWHPTVQSVLPGVRLEREGQNFVQLNAVRTRLSTVVEFSDADLLGWKTVSLGFDSLTAATHRVGLIADHASTIAFAEIEAQGWYTPELGSGDPALKFISGLRLEVEYGGFRAETSLSY